MRFHVIWHLTVGLAVLTAIGCRGDRLPISSTQPLPEPPASYPAPSKSGSPAPVVESASRAPIAADSVVWDHLGSWTGHGSMQTESFPGETGAFRIKWEARPEHSKSGKVAGKPAEPGTFKVTIHSAISGRPLSVAVDQSGAGADTAYVNEDPRVFFAVVDASHIEWSFSVEEAVGTRVPRKQ